MSVEGEVTEVAAVQEAEEPVLPCVRKVLDAFHDAGVRYCHWKSNEHVLAGMQGKTDLDILVDHGQRDLCTKVMMEAGYKRFQAVGASSYPGIEDHIALDLESLRLSHLHVHYRLMVGEKHLKGYRLPWEHDLLEARQWNQQLDIYTASPEMELVLLMIRAVLKRRSRDRFQRLVGRRRTSIDDHREFEWLAHRVNLQSLDIVSNSLLNVNAAARISKTLDHGYSVGEVNRLRRSVYSSLQAYRYYGPLEARRRRWLREANQLYCRLRRRLGSRTTMVRRVLPHGGVIIALVGVDGAGKSTQAKSLAKLLGTKLDVTTIYMGSGDGRTSFLRAVLEIPIRILRPLYRRSSSPAKSVHTRTSLSWRRAIWAISLAIEKRGKLKQAWRASAKGLIVLTDRYPQTDILGYNDGPLLYTWRSHQRGIKRWLAEWEFKQYSYATRHPPTLVVKLALPHAIAVQRKADTGPQMAQAKIDALSRIVFAPSARCKEVDAAQGTTLVLRDIASSVWDSL